MATRGQLVSLLIVLTVPIPLAAQTPQPESKTTVLANCGESATERVMTPPCVTDAGAVLETTHPLISIMCSIERMIELYPEGPTKSRHARTDV